MRIIKIPKKKFELLKNEQHEISNLTSEVDQALKFYDEHPQYKLNYNKIREKVAEINSRMHRLENTISEFDFNNFQNKNNSSSNNW